MKRDEKETETGESMVYLFRFLMKTTDSVEFF